MKLVASSQLFLKTAAGETVITRLPRESPTLMSLQTSPSHKVNVSCVARCPHTSTLVLETITSGIADNNGDKDFSNSGDWIAHNVVFQTRSTRCFRKPG